MRWAHACVVTDEFESYTEIKGAIVRGALQPIDLESLEDVAMPAGCGYLCALRGSHSQVPDLALVAVLSGAEPMASEPHCLLPGVGQGPY